MEVRKSKEKQCLVCYKSSNGMHFGAITCRACAAFFRRTIVSNFEYECGKRNNNCDVDENGKFACRYCRYIKCQQIGMKPDTLKLDYDPTFSIKGSIDDYSGNEISNTNSSICSPSYSKSEEENGENNRYLFNFSPKPSNKPIVEIDFLDLSKNIEYLFDNSQNEENEKDELKLLTTSILDFRKNQKNKMIEINQMEIFDMVKLLKNEIIWKWAKWMNSSNLFKTIGKQQKMQLFQNSWNILHIFERLQITSKNEELLKSNEILISDNLLWICGKSYYNISSISEITNQYFSKLFDPYLQRFIDEIGKKLYEMKIADEELIFCLVQLHIRI
ncbi:unnamed protein product [Caenorhabditis angaria]|uniref:Nuclear receptor domain-containing protein n=1 Tax=Caenorhabditis angaria TaxID=860376 RepID=A0A9P1N3Y3_9PELO|nr:unnamed protein product [Caenorhabditis angaria]